MTPRGYNWSTCYHEKGILNKLKKKIDGCVEVPKDSEFTYYTSWYESKSQSLTQPLKNAVATQLIQAWNSVVHGNWDKNMIDSTAKKWKHKKKHAVNNKNTEQIPRACPISCTAIPWNPHPEPREICCFPPTLPTFDQQLNDRREIKRKK